MGHKLSLLSSLILALVAGLLLAAERGDGARELGAVQWGRDLDAALARSAQDGRPVFVLFQEVPGCSTCVSFGEQVLSHPLLVEAIETEFHPVFVYNNRPGRDAEILERFDEPAWNNPVVRLLDSDGNDLISRRAGVWTPHRMGERMVQALDVAGRNIPRFLHETVDETRPRSEERATFGMDCYWRGEACLGAIPGILSSRTGFLGGSEVVEVRFDPDTTTYESLKYPTTVSGDPSFVYPVEVQATTACGGAYVPVSAVTGLAVDKSGGGVEICWDPVHLSESCVEGYRVLGSGSFDTDAGFSTLADAGLTPCWSGNPPDTYFLVVTRGSGGTGPWEHYGN